jgi:ankyrin repeat protein
MCRISSNDTKADINSSGLEQRTALHWAVYENKTEIAKILLKHGANVEAKTNKNRTPLHIACILGQAEISLILLQTGASVDAQDKDNNTPFHYAAYYSKLIIIIYIRER